MTSVLLAMTSVLLAVTSVLLAMTSVLLAVTTNSHLVGIQTHLAMIATKLAITDCLDIFTSTLVFWVSFNLPPFLRINNILSFVGALLGNIAARVV